MKKFEILPKCDTDWKNDLLDAGMPQTFNWFKKKKTVNLKYSKAK